MKDDDELDLPRDMHNISVLREHKLPYRTGDSVCIAMTRRPLKGIHWAMELFVMTDKLHMIPTTYRVKDMANELIDGTFYEP